MLLSGGLCVENTVEFLSFSDLNIEERNYIFVGKNQIELLICQIKSQARNIPTKQMTCFMNRFGEAI